VGRPQTLMLFPKAKLLKDSHLHINKAVCTLGSGNGVDFLEWVVIEVIIVS